MFCFASNRMLSYSPDSKTAKSSNAADRTEEDHNCAHFVLNSTTLQPTQAYFSQSRVSRKPWPEWA